MSKIDIFRVLNRAVVELDGIIAIEESIGYDPASGKTALFGNPTPKKRGLDVICVTG